MDKPSRLLLKLSDRLFSDTHEREAFIQSLLQPQGFNPCILWCQKRPEEMPFALEPVLEWQPASVDRLSLGQKPGQHSLHETGAFYCLDFSSVFAISVLAAIPTAIDLVMDVCASPGGKSIFSWVALQPQLLISNEVIGKRSGALISNLKRCQVTPAIVLRLDAKILAQEIPKTAPLVLVDAPCSGQSLIAKGGKNPGCFHPVNVNNNANRQKRILANSAQLVAPEGYLIYMTCTYAIEENEQVIDWFLERFPQFQAVKVGPLSAYQSHLTEQPCYRMFPQGGLGAGAFTTLLQNTEPGQKQVINPDFFEQSRAIFL